MSCGMSFSMIYTHELAFGACESIGHLRTVQSNSVFIAQPSCSKPQTVFINLRIECVARSASMPHKNKYWCSSLWKFRSWINLDGIVWFFVKSVCRQFCSCVWAFSIQIRCLWKVCSQGLNLLSMQESGFNYDLTLRQQVMNAVGGLLQKNVNT